MKHTVCVSLAFAVVIAIGCDGSGVVRTGVPQNDKVTPFPDEEAELAALWLSGDLVAPEGLYATIKRDLARIRAAYADTTLMLSIGFRPPWEASRLLTQFTSEGVQKIRDGDYPELAALNARFGLTSLDTTSSLWGNHGTARMEFSGRKHPLVLAAPYGMLGDVTWSAPNYYIGDWSCVYPWEIEGGMSYLFRHGSGDCPAGCIHSIFWYYRVVDGTIEFVGRYDTQYDPPPPWWDEAKTAYYAYRGYER